MYKSSQLVSESGFDRAAAGCAECESGFDRAAGCATCGRGFDREAADCEVSVRGLDHGQKIDEGR
jgi:hypothetical protein